MTTWNTSNYKQRKAARLLAVKPEWIINPETGEEFYLRKVGGLLSSVLAGSLPAGLTAEAAKAWAEQGVEGIGVNNVLEFVAQLTPAQREANERESRELSAIIQRACVIPFLSNSSAEEVDVSEEWKAEAAKGMKEKDPKFDAATFDFKELVFNPKDLDDKDSVFLFAWARGLADGVRVKGGVVSAGNFHPVSKKLARGVRTGANKSEVLKAAV